ncbi:CocE/NonD family hydrolase [Rhodococcus sp. T2V]|uniref:CocE/NonD family hydrolase n=1 Tax=Rhodococcus sp. T2V TaxID=3034164 RepID=UPI0023E1AEF4|nr:CocE/NonD family hydrolase [Rhodococcus sp. T2V]MDF3309707.1 CocE/NonD family hydrolase [Rhodococcus sp. T2V]
MDQKEAAPLGGAAHPRVGVLARTAGKVLDRALNISSTAVPYDVERNIEVPMGDGVVLLGDLYRATADTGPQPTVLIRSPYGRKGIVEMTAAAPLARRGFQVFLQSTRGTFGSGGQFRPFTTEKDDGVETVAWVRRQPWSDGQVAMTGDSYNGHVQWAVAPYVDPPLAAVAPNVTAADITSAFYDHGVPCLETALEYSSVIARQERSNPLLTLLPHPRRNSRVRKVLRSLPVGRADSALLGAPLPFWRDVVHHADPGDTYWAVADHSGIDYATMPPTNMTTGWGDLFLKSQLEDYRRLRQAGVDARLRVGPWLHGSVGRLRYALREDIEFLDHNLRGGPAPSRAPVRLYLQQADTWLEFENWPPAEATPVSVALQSNGKLTYRLGPAEGQPSPGIQKTSDGSQVEERSACAPSRFTYDPSDPTPTVGGPSFKPGGLQIDNKEIERRSDVLVFTGEPLSTDTDIVGVASARIYLRTSLPYADLFVRVCDVDPKGVSRNVIDGIRRLDQRTVPAPDVKELEKGILAVDVELSPTAHRFKATHRIRVQVSGGAFPRYARNLGTGDPFASSTAYEPCDFEVFHDADRPSEVTLTMIESTAAN